MKNTILLVVLLIFPASLYATDYLKIGDVQNSWNTYDGSIDKAVLVITPKGLFAECQLYLDFSVACTQFTNPYDSLEIQMGFHLPSDAEVTDLWLWINNIPVQAGIYDRWTAAQIYEGFVNRRTDPALLLKQTDTEYKLNIFPLMVNLPRKIKMTFLIPFDKLTGIQSLVNLPLSIIQQSFCPLDSVMIAYKPDNNLSDPKLLELPIQSFQPITDSLIGFCYATTLSSASQLSSLTFSVSGNAASNYFTGFNIDTITNEGVYELELNLADILGIQASKKTLFLVDFMNNNSSLSKAHVMQTIKNYITSYFVAGDSLNFMFSGIMTNSLSSGWISADSASLGQLLNSLDVSLVTGYTNLPVLLIDGINFIQTTGYGGNIVLISSSNQYATITNANNLFNDVAAFMGNPKIPIHTINLDDYSYLTSYGNNYYYRGNEYLYRTLSSYTGGEFQTIKEEWYDNNNWINVSNYYSFETMLTVLFPALTGYFTATNISTTLQSGFTFADYNFNAVNGFVYFGSPYRQVGKYYGSFPMQISIAALSSTGQFYNAQLTIDSMQMVQLDTVAQCTWVGQYMRNLFSYNQTGNVVNQIIQASRSERVLSMYTAFLALEPGIIVNDTAFDPFTDTPGGGIGIAETENTSSFSVYCFPNPVTDIVNFEFSLNEPAEVTIEIFNLFGQKMATLLSDKLITGKQVMKYNANELASGIYFYKIKLNNKECSNGKISVLK